MPIYEYKCEDCGEVTEVLVRNTQAQVNVECKSCKSNDVSRIISAPGAVRVKGGSQAVPPSHVRTREIVECRMVHVLHPNRITIIDIIKLTIALGSPETLSRKGFWSTKAYLFNRVSQKN
jgi:putative FmdB family regulatory protein